MSKLMICVDITDESINAYKNQLKDFDWNRWDEVHLVHGFETQVYADTFYFASYPLEGQMGDIEKSVSDLLLGLSNEIIAEDYKGKVFGKCLFASSAKVALKEYAEENKIDEMIIETRGKHGIAALFSSSFAEYMVGHAPCRLMILREVK